MNEWSDVIPWGYTTSSQGVRRIIITTPKRNIWVEFLMRMYTKGCNSYLGVRRGVQFWFGSTCMWESKVLGEVKVDIQNWDWELDTSLWKSKVTLKIVEDLFSCWFVIIRYQVPQNRKSFVKNNIILIIVFFDNCLKSSFFGFNQMNGGSSTAMLRWWLMISQVS